MAVEVEPYENEGGRIMKERETCSGRERESTKKNILIFGIRDRYEIESSNLCETIRAV